MSMATLIRGPPAAGGCGSSSSITGSPRSTVQLVVSIQRRRVGGRFLPMHDGRCQSARQLARRDCDRHQTDGADLNSRLGSRYVWPPCWSSCSGRAVPGSYANHCRRHVGGARKVNPMILAGGDDKPAPAVKNNPVFSRTNE
jgi:hypothetical protein